MESKGPFPEYDALMLEGGVGNASYTDPNINQSDQFATGPSNEGLFIPLYIYITVSIVNVFIFVVGTVGNILVIIIVIKIREMRTPTNLFLLNLSAADVLVLLVCQPAALLEFFGKDRWFLGNFMCKSYFTRLLYKIHI